MTPRPSRIPGVASGAAAFLGGFAKGIKPPPVMNVNTWAKSAPRVVSADSGSPNPGAWDETLAPYLSEIHDALSPSEPAPEVTIMGSAQIGKSEPGLNLIGASICQDPSPMLIVLPTTAEATKYNKLKLQPTIDATPELRSRVLDVTSRDAEGSTAGHKKFRGGYCVLTHAHSSTGLQMISARRIIFEEISSYPPDAGGRGDPVAQAEARAKAWSLRKPKRAYISTPDQKGTCRITARYEESDQRRYYVPCPQCGNYQVLQWKNMKWVSAERPHGAYMVCAANGCVIQHMHKRGMVAGGRWIKTFEGDEANPKPPESFAPEALARWRSRPSAGRYPGFHIWQAYSPFVGWDDTVASYIDAQGKPLALKTFWQQGLGEAWEDKGDAPASEKLIERNQAYPWRVVPPGALFITAMTDVQGDRLEYGVYAWSAGLAHGWWIDGGIIIGDPATPAPWKELEEVLNRTYEDQWGRAWDIDAFGIDCGYLSNHVYKFCKDHHRTERQTRQVFALDGVAGWKKPPIGLPTKVTIDFEGKKDGAVLKWPVCTFEMKQETYTALRNTIAGAGESGEWALPVLHFNQRCDRNFFEQLTAEHQVDERHKSGVMQKVWKLPERKRNEQLDIAVGARALAHHYADDLTAAQWTDLAARRAAKPEAAQRDLAALWAPKFDMPPAPAAEPETPPANAVRQEPARRVGRSRFMES